MARLSVSVKNKSADLAERRTRRHVAETGSGYHRAFWVADQNRAPKNARTFKRCREYLFVLT